MQFDLIHRALGRFASASLVLALAACSDSTGPDAPTENVVVVLNSVGLTLTVVPLGSPNVRTLALGPDGTPTTLAVRDSVAAVPMGITNVLALVNLNDGTVRNIPLPAGSGATGVAFASDSIVMVANSDRNTVSPINWRRGTVGAEIPVGNYPQALVADPGRQRVYAVNGNLDDSFQPAGPGTVTVIDAGTHTVAGTVALTGINSGSASVRGEQLFVLNSGTWGGNNSSLSMVNLGNQQEVRRVDQFGNFPGSVTTQAGRAVFVAAYGTGVLVYSPEADVIERTAANPMIPAGLLPVAAVRFDELGLLYSLHPGDCTSPGRLVQMGATGGVLAQVDVGVCPFALDFGVVRPPA